MRAKKQLFRPSEGWEGEQGISLDEYLEREEKTKKQNKEASK